MEVIQVYGNSNLNLACIYELNAEIAMMHKKYKVYSNLQVKNEKKNYPLYILPRQSVCIPRRSSANCLFQCHWYHYETRWLTDGKLLNTYDQLCISRS